MKGLRTLLTAVATSTTIRRHELWLAGEGEAREELERFCREHALTNVRFLGQLSPGQLAPIVSNARFVVLPSEWYENAPMSILEAAACGKAAAVSEIGGLPELVRDGDTGVVVPPGDATALRYALEDLLSSPDAAVAMGERARAFVEDAFGPDQHYKRLMDIYRRVGASLPIHVAGS